MFFFFPNTAPPAAQERNPTRHQTALHAVYSRVTSATRCRIIILPTAVRIRPSTHQHPPEIGPIAACQGSLEPARIAPARLGPFRFVSILLMLTT
ncbi:hypothetical protein ABB37_08257 [Leptomonas pyrrhocoris]|uniref:Uncharacterized protein n=1 Tax=Leptomonas pyrrhocoris TaxID=157538 RepID=A0A0M9FTE2_LEPPY|nr:hypothetical protein ABB37_08257 [Leptomonas pyrrhocoris]XP_015654138.1 hypothetical protein ABB37_08257 [Leptomonas pyrrhocoris]XP_015654139.1 hypothetical protein ABB37_08257 [Leptomonas pyrrhocoris]KPA75698.1 hypothetical protein ABB37_08257 [Leptomonas pyrrhocoris]KPA75699.1 hypothetical protein ABB37_08257 [Leptomonas pyrrhocoris]KPA75700.1 hypothetical protein ABB37_08257 [Leptomonas pyrrhocoris]|eukprot:XP_015654137.1 hypothetical protein ABB37_08257 [Leptomonas pyrrhocoris]